MKFSKFNRIHKGKNKPALSNSGSHNGRSNGSTAISTNGHSNGYKPNSVVNNRVLLLNQNYQPLTVCSARRAIVMSMMGSVEIIEIHETVGVRTVSRVYDLPTVVRLGRYVKTPIRKVLLNRKNLLLRDNHKCQYCGVGGANLTIDHIIPRRKGGQDTWENLVTACSPCNSKKGNRTPEQAGYQLARKPKRPDRISFIRQSAHSTHKSWRPYLFMD